MKQGSFVTGTSALLLSCIALVSGCSTWADGREEYRGGWREAYVVEADIGARQLDESVGDCRKDATAPTDLWQYALVSYLDGHQRKQRVAAVSRSMASIQQGQFYRINVQDCTVPWRPAKR